MTEQTKKDPAWLILAVALLLALCLKIPSLFQPHLETDELVFLNLAANLADSGNYSLQSTPILPYLSPAIYDKPFFQHPPLFVMLIAPLVTAISANSAVVVSWLGHLLALLAVFLLGRHTLGRENRLLLGIILAFAVFDPLLVFTSQKIWIDSLLGGITALAAALFLLGTAAGAPARQRQLLLAAGVATGLAILTKMPAILILVVYAAAYLARHQFTDTRQLRVYLLFFLVPFLVIILPWFVKFYGYYGMLIPDWMAPDARLLETNRFVAAAKRQPPYFYFSLLLLLTPVILIPIYTVCRRGRHLDAASWTYVLWLLLVPTAMTVLALTGGHTFQGRYITMAAPPLYILLGITLKEMQATRQPLLLAGLFCCFLISVATSFYYIFNQDIDSITNIAAVAAELF